MKTATKSILITGASGFIGSSLVTFLKKQDFKIKTISRTAIAETDYLAFNAFSNSPRKNHHFFSDVDVVIHCAAIAHFPKKSSADEIRKINIDYTQQIFEAAALGGCSHFVYISSIAAKKCSNNHFSPDSYAGAKHFSELFLLNEQIKYPHIKLTIIRPPMVYGPEAPGNMNRLVLLLRKPILLPLKSFKTPVSFLHIDNLCSGILSVINHSNNQKNRSQIWEICDPWSETLDNFIGQIIKRNNHPAILIPFPKIIIQLALKALNREKDLERLTSLPVITPAPFQSTFNWTPAIFQNENYKLEL